MNKILTIFGFCNNFKNKDCFKCLFIKCYRKNNNNQIIHTEDIIDINNISNNDDSNYTLLNNHTIYKIKLLNELKFKNELKFSSLVNNNHTIYTINKMKLLNELKSKNESNMCQFDNNYIMI